MTPPPALVMLSDALDDAFSAYRKLALAEVEVVRLTNVNAALTLEIERLEAAKDRTT